MCNDVTMLKLFFTYMALIVCRPVIVEIPHFASLRDDREIQVLRSDDGKRWEDHRMQPSDDVVFKAINDSFDGKC